MSSLVLSLQQDALDTSVSTATLLRKALVVAKKLDIGEIEEWLTDELNGYADGTDVPEYRFVRGEIKVFNPYRGWIPLHFGDTSAAERLSRRATSQSISELESVAEGESGYMPFPPKLEKRLMDGMEFPMQPALHIDPTQIRAIVERVRNMILEWALNLEKQGVLGEGMSFTPDEKRTAHSIYHIHNLIGSMSESQIQQDTIGSTQTYQKSIDIEAVRSIVDELESRKRELRLSESDREELDNLLSSVSQEVESSKPNVAAMREGLVSIRSVVESAAGSALFQGVLLALRSLI